MKQLEGEENRAETQVRKVQELEMIGRLAGGVAHDLNNVLTTIALTTEFFLRQLEPADPLYTRAEDIKLATKRASLLTDQLLSFGHREIRQPKLLNLNEIVADVLHLFGQAIGEDISVTDRLSADPWPIRADAGQVEQVILNLLINAADAMPDGGHLYLETANVKLTHEVPCINGSVPPGTYVLLAVTDTGTGIDPELEPSIFEPYVSTKSKRGSGLGLATVHRIVHQSGGHITIETGIGRGSTFSVYLPSVQETMPTAPLWEPSGILTPGSETILVVEEDRALRHLMLETLSHQGYRAFGASSGRKALRKTEAALAAVDLLVAEVIMPDMRGPELVEKLQARRHRMKVLFVTGHLDESLRHNFERERLPFLAKPFTCARLTSKVRDVLDGTDRDTL